MATETKNPRHVMLKDSVKAGIEKLTGESLSGGIETLYLKAAKKKAAVETAAKSNQTH